MASISPIADIVVPEAGPLEPEPMKFAYMEKEAFHHKFAGYGERYPMARNIETDEAKASDFSVTSWFVGDCITLFAVEMDPANPAEVRQLSGFHSSFDGATDVGLIEEYFSDFLDGSQAAHTQIYLIGGYPIRTNDAGKSLLDLFHDAVELYFGTRDVIKRELCGEDLTRIHGEYTFLSANLSIGLDGQPELAYTIDE